MFKKKEELSVLIIINFIVSGLLTYTSIIKNNLNKYSLTLRNSFEIAVFIKKAETKPEKVFEQVRSLSGIKQIKFISSSQVIEKMKFLEREIFLSGANPFPNSLSIIPDEVKINKIKELNDKLRQNNSIEEICYDENKLLIVDGLDKYYKLTDLILKIISITIGLIFVIFLFVCVKQKIYTRPAQEFLPFVGSSVVGVFLGYSVVQTISSRLLVLSENLILESPQECLNILFIGVIIGFIWVFFRKFQVINNKNN